jgi:hypothetical protein
MRKITATILTGASCLAAYYFLIRPWHLCWGATGREVKMSLQGDDVKPDAKVQVTHAITIDAPADEVWKWLIQIGQGRGGFYSYDWLENLFDLQILNAKRIVPELQNLKVGDFVRSAHEGWLGGKFDGKAGWYVVGLEPNRALVLRDEIERGSWAFILNPINGQQTRLIVRARGNASATLGGELFHYAFFEPAHFIMERKMLLTLKQKAEDSFKQERVQKQTANAEITPAEG